MLKSLLLATSVVIGSGTGAIQNGAHFNETKQTTIVESQPKAQITNTSTDTYELFTITTPDNYKTQASYQTFNYNQEEKRSNILRQQNKFSNAGTIICNTSSTLTYDPTAPNRFNRKEFVAYIQITPYLNYTNGEFTLKLNLNLYDDYNQEAQTDIYTYVHIVETEYNLTEFAYMGNYGERNFAHNYLNTIIDEIPPNEKTQTTEEYSDVENKPNDNFHIQNEKVYWEIEKTITISKNPKYIVVYAYVEDNLYEYGLINWSPCYLDNTTIKCYVTRGGGTYEVVDLPGLLFDILTMPFTFISRAFNVTLFPNTPYQLNIADIFIAIFAALVFIFIVKTFIKK